MPRAAYEDVRLSATLKYRSQTVSKTFNSGPAERRALEARQPHGRLVSADEIAAAVVYLVSPTAGSTTGTELAVDGGMAGLRLRPRP